MTRCPSQDWDRHANAEEAAHYGACHEHAAKFGINEDTEDYMVRNGIDDCKDMPCAEGCPFSVKKE